MLHQKLECQDQNSLQPTADDDKEEIIEEKELFVKEQLDTIKNEIDDLGEQLDATKTLKENLQFEKKIITYE